MSPKGGWDKVIIESLMAQCPVFASNLALKPVFGAESDKFLFEPQNPQDLAYKVESFLALQNQEEIIKVLQNHVVAEYDFKNLIKKICSFL